MLKRIAYYRLLELSASNSMILLEIKAIIFWGDDGPVDQIIRVAAAMIYQDSLTKPCL